MTTRILLYATLNWPSAARYAAGFHAAGCDVHALAPQGAPVSVSRYLTGFHAYSVFQSVKALRKATAETKADLIVACDDRAVSHLLCLYEEERAKPKSALADLLRRSLGKPENYGRVLSRSGSLAELRVRGVPIPKTFPVGSDSELEACINALGLPIVLKADGSWGGDGVIVAQTREEARAAFRKLSRAPSRLRSLGRAYRRRDTHFLLAAWKPKAASVCAQAFVEGGQAASAFAAHNGKITAMFHYDVLMSDGRNGPPKVIRRIDNPEMDGIVQTVAKHFHLSGLHGLDYIRDAQGRAHLIEINPRATKGGSLAFGEGRDLPSGLVQAMSAAPVGRRARIPSNVVLLQGHGLDPRDVKGAFEDIPHDDPDVLAILNGEPLAARQRTRAGRMSELRTVKTAG